MRPPATALGLAGGRGEDKGEPKFVDSYSAELEVRTVGAFFHVVNIGGDAVVLADVADAVEMHLFVAGRAAHAVAMHHPLQPFVEGGAAFRAAHPHPDVLDFFLVRIVHGGRPLLARMRPNY